MSIKPVLQATEQDEKEIMRFTNVRFESLGWCGPIAGFALAMLSLLMACFAPNSLAARSGQATFKSPEEASEALFMAARGHDEQALTHILGGGSELLSSGDKAQDKLDQEQFVQKYQEMHRLARETHGDRLLYIGAQNWPFPMPLMSRDGIWHFDANAGQQEIQFRRIGEDEVTTIALCHTLVAAQSDPGTAGASDGLTATVLQAARSGSHPVPFHGYFFRILRDGDHEVGVIAYPAVYRQSGVMTFLISHDDVVHQKDLGPDTAKFAAAMAGYEADATWTPAETRG
jgi:hypothetical protein